MSYDIRMHMPQRIENMFNIIENAGPLNQFDNVIDSMKTLCADNGFIQDITDYEKERDKQLADAKKLFVDSVLKAIETKNYDELVKGINDAQTTLESTTGDIIEEYVDIVKTYIISFMPQVDIKGYE